MQKKCIAFILGRNINDYDESWHCWIDRSISCRRAAIVSQFCPNVGHIFWSFACFANTPYIQKTDTAMRVSILASIRLVLTLRFLTSGDNLWSIQNINVLVAINTVLVVLKTIILTFLLILSKSMNSDNSITTMVL